MNAWAESTQSPIQGWSADGTLSICRLPSVPSRPSKAGWSEATETAFRSEAIRRQPTETAIRPRYGATYRISRRYSFTACSREIPRTPLPGSPRRGRPERECKTDNGQWETG